MKTRYTISQSYSEVTPESASLGDFSETGWVDEKGWTGTLKDVLQAIKNQGFEHIQFNGKSVDVYGNFYTSDYRTGTERQECLHIEADSRAIEWLQKIIDGGAV